MTQKQRRPSLRRSYLNSLAIATMSPADRVAALRAELVELEASLSGAPGMLRINVEAVDPKRQYILQRGDEIVAGIGRIKGEEPPR